MKKFHDQITESKYEMEKFQLVFLDKEKAIRRQVFEMKKIKRSLRDLVTNHSENSEIHQFILQTTER